MNPRKDGWHCENCWDEHHNGLKDKDWIDLEEWIASGRAQEYIDMRDAYDKDIKILAEKLIDECGFCRHPNKKFDENSWRCPDCGEGGID